jgi:hypothetical protein
LDVPADAPTVPADELDAFGDPADATAPPADAGDDLFGPSAATETPSGVVPTTAEDSADDLFGADAVDAAPTDAGTMPDLGTPDEPTTPDASAPAGDDLFDAPADATEGAPANEGTSAADDVDDLFSRADQQLERQADEQRATVATSHAASSTTPEAQGMASRMWVDNTGLFTTEGRLIEIGRTYVKLVKDNGRTSTVPLARLSATDFAYIRGLAQRIQNGEKLPLIANR